ncbi:hypothetical protein ABPG72_014894 [Tetrahymena utriculariae]
MPNTLYQQNSRFLNIYQNNRQICNYSFSILYFFTMTSFNQQGTLYYKLAIHQTCFQYHYIMQKPFILSKYSTKPIQLQLLPQLIKKGELSNFYQITKFFQNQVLALEPY